MPSLLRWGLLLLVAALLAFVSLRMDLTPRVESDFFFAVDTASSGQDPFAKTRPQIILSVEADDIQTPAYAERVRALSAELSATPGIVSVLDIAHGPKNLKDASESPFWSRLLLSEDGRATQLIVSLDGFTREMVPKIENLVARHQQQDFRIAISGVPYVVELISRQLFRDLKAFALATLAVFSLLVLVLSRSWTLLMGTLVSCITASVGTLLALYAVGMKPGILTANVLTITFVMTLSHIVFLTMNWADAGSGVRQAIRWTAMPSFWSMATTLLGFLSLLLATAKPLREFGISGAIGCGVSILAAYALYPLYLRGTRPPQAKGVSLRFLSGPHRWALPVAAALVAVSVPGLLRLGHEPGLLSYFKSGSDIRRGLESIDRRTGSVPLDLVVHQPGTPKLTTKEAVARLWALQLELENDPEVGAVLSLAVLLKETDRQPGAFLLSTEGRIELLEQPKYFEIGKTFVTKDRKHARYVMRMHEGIPEIRREETLRRIREIVRRHGFEVTYYAGLYEQMGRLSSLVWASVYRGLAGLLALFTVISFVVSRSFRWAASMTFGLCTIAGGLLGAIGLLGIPVDIISSTAANLAIGMGIDGMLHLVACVRRDGRSWAEARMRTGIPILASSFIVAGGFGVFLLSSFPPTQRFGIFVVVGTGLAAFVVLFVLPRPFANSGEGAATPPSA